MFWINQVQLHGYGAGRVKTQEMSGAVEERCINDKSVNVIVKSRPVTTVK